MNNEFKEIASQLHIIKKVFFFGVGCLFFMMVSDVYYIFDDIRENKEMKMGYTFHSQASYMVQQKDWDTLLTLSQERKRGFPADPYGAWFEGIAYSWQEKWDDAIGSFKETALIDPRFAVESRKAIEEMQNRKERSEREKETPR